MKTELYPYQQEDVALAVSRGSMLVAYEMGLGKTIMALAILEQLFDKGISRAVIVVPANLKWQWAKAMAQHTECETREVKAGTVPVESVCTVINGSVQARANQYLYVRDVSPRYIILSYEQVVTDWDKVKRLNPDAIVLDEATYIKNFKAARTKTVKKFVARYRFALSGQPVESRPEELFSIMQWVDADVLGGYAGFDARYIVRDFFGGVKHYLRLDELHERLSEAMIRKTRHDPDVAPYLPDVQQEDILIRMDQRGRALYKRLVADFLEEIKKPGAQKSFDEFAFYHGVGDEASGGSKANAIYGAMLALCAHPDVLVKSAQDYERSEALRAVGKKGALPGSKYAYELWQEGLLDPVVKAPKFETALEEMKLILDTHPDNKVILFSKYRWVVQELTHIFGDICVDYHGDMNSTEKSVAVNKFRTDPKTRVFLSTDAGAYGVDLPEGTHLINYNIPPNAGRWEQRNARHARAGSKHDTVYVLNLLVEGSVEVRQLLMTELRLDLAAAIVDGGRGDLKNDIPTVTEWINTHTL